MAGGTALAVNTVCKEGGVTCNGTSSNDLLIGTDAGENLNGFAGNDQFVGNGGNDNFNTPTNSSSGAGSDTYIFTDGFGADTLNDSGPATDRETVDFSKVPTNMQIYAIPEYGSNFMQASAGTNKVTFSTGTTIEKIVGSAGNDNIEGGKQNNTYDLRAGGDDFVTDNGGADTLFGEDDNDTVNSKDGVNGNDSLDGGPGTDTKVTDATEKTIIGFP